MYKNMLIKVGMILHQINYVTPLSENPMFELDFLF